MRPRLTASCLSSTALEGGSEYRLEPALNSANTGAESPARGRAFRNLTGLTGPYRKNAFFGVNQSFWTKPNDESATGREIFPRPAADCVSYLPCGYEVAPTTVTASVR